MLRQLILHYVERFHRWQNRHLVEHVTTPLDDPCAVKGHAYIPRMFEWHCVRCGICIPRLTEDNPMVVDWKGRKVEFLYEVPNDDVRLAMIRYGDTRNIVRMRDLTFTPEQEQHLV